MDGMNAASTASRRAIRASAVSVFRIRTFVEFDTANSMQSLRLIVCPQRTPEPQAAKPIVKPNILKILIVILQSVLITHIIVQSACQTCKMLIIKKVRFGRSVKKCKALHFSVKPLHYLNVRQKTVSAESLRVSSMVPLWLRMICREMLRPMPLP